MEGICNTTNNKKYILNKRVSWASLRTAESGLRSRGSGGTIGIPARPQPTLRVPQVGNAPCVRITAPTIPLLAPRTRDYATLYGKAKHNKTHPHLQVGFG